MNVTRAIIPVAGLGTRMLPATKSIPKEMLPIFDKPLIQYVVAEAIASGIKDIILVTRSGKSAIDNHFNINTELEALLALQGKHELLSAIRKSVHKDISICSITQQEAKGLGHAVLCAKSMMGNEPFAVLLPDVLIDEFFCDLGKDNLSAMIEKFNRTKNSQILVEPVPMDRTHLYGIVDCDNKELLSGKSCAITGIIEKPSLFDTPSNLSVVGRYVFNSNIWKHLEKVKPDKAGEIQLTEAIADLSQKETVEAYCIVGKSHDCGNKCGYAKANLAYAFRDKKVGVYLEEYIKEAMQFERKTEYTISENI